MLKFESILTKNSPTMSVHLHCINVATCHVHEICQTVSVQTHYCRLSSEIWSHRFRNCCTCIIFLHFWQCAFGTSLEIQVLDLKTKISPIWFRKSCLVWKIDFMKITFVEFSIAGKLTIEEKIRTMLNFLLWRKFTR